MKKTIAGVLALTGLALTLIPAILVFMGKISLSDHKNFMLLGMVLWFGAAPFWRTKSA